MTYQHYSLDDPESLKRFDQNILRDVRNCLKVFWERVPGYKDIKIHDEPKFFISGGVIPNMINFFVARELAGEEVLSFKEWLNDPKSDIDIFVNAKSVYDLNDIISPIFESPESELILGNNNYTQSAFTFDFENFLTDSFQIIHAEHGAPMEVVKNFDFRFTQGYYIPADGSLHISKAILSDILNKRLILTGRTGKNGSPEKTQHRIDKWESRGYKIPKESFFPAPETTKLGSNLVTTVW